MVPCKSASWGDPSKTLDDQAKLGLAKYQESSGDSRLTCPGFALGFQQGISRGYPSNRAIASWPVPSSDDHEPDARTMAALATINNRYQQVIRLCYLEGLSLGDAAVSLGMTRPVLAITHTRAIKALRRALGGEPPDLPELKDEP
jgi:predicted DNA-binding protein (UPF0251 family)